MSDHTEPIHPRLLELFDEPSLRERWRLIVSGLRKPHATGEYKWARFQMKRLLSPVSAVVLPLLLLLLIALLASAPHPAEECIGVTSLPPPVPLPPLDELPVLPEPELPEPIVFEVVPFISDDVATSPTETLQPLRPQLTEIASIPDKGVIETRCPVVMPGIYKKRAAAAQGQAATSGTGASATTEVAVLRALRWLKSVQESDGSWLLESGAGAGSRPGSGAAPAMTGLALLTFLAHGETPNSEEFGYTVEKGLKWLVASQEPDGRFKGRDAHDYSHPIAAFALCEAYGMTGNPLLSPVASRAVQVVIDGQNQHGGWTYNCKPEDRNDLSYMGWCVQAIKAAKLAKVTCRGLEEALARAEGGLCYNASPGGAFGYTGPTQSHLTGVGVLGLQLLGYKSPGRIAKGLAALEAATYDWDHPQGRNPIYYWYYITQAKRLQGGKGWDLWNRQFAPEAASHQVLLPGAGEDGKDVGYWESASASEHCKSRVYNTTLCTLTLEVYYKVGGFSELELEATKHASEDPDDVPLEIIDV